MDLRLVLVHVESGGEDAVFGERFGERRFVDHRSARGVDEDGFGFHLLQLSGADEVRGLLGERGVEGEEVALLEQFVELQVARVELFFGFLSAGAARVEDLHVESPGAAGEGLTDPAEPYYAEFLAPDIWADEHLRPPGLPPPGSHDPLPLAQT